MVVALKYPKFTCARSVPITWKSIVSLYDSHCSDTIGDFTVLSMAIIVLVLLNNHHHELDDVTIIAQLVLQVYLQGI